MFGNNIKQSIRPPKRLRRRGRCEPPLREVALLLPRSWRGWAKKEEIGALCDAADRQDRPGTDDAHLRAVTETLVAAGMPARALKALAGANGILALYMRSSIELKAGDKAAADTDWDAAMKTADSASSNESKKESWLNLGGLMHDWHDERAEGFFQKVLATPPDKTAFDVLACFQMGALMEEQKENARAIGYYEKGLDICKALHGQYSTATPDNHGIRVFFLDDDAAPVREKLRKLNAQAPADATPATVPGKTAPS